MSVIRRGIAMKNEDVCGDSRDGNGWRTSSGGGKQLFSLGNGGVPRPKAV